MDFPLDPGVYPVSELRKARRRHLVRQSVLLQRPLIGPMEVGLIPTYRCNHGCSFCALPYEVSGHRGEMTDEDLTSVVEALAAADCEQVSLTGGGEPLLHPATPAVVEQVRARGMACSVCTNGTLVTEQLADRWARLGVHLAVSFNAASEATYRAIHRGAKPAHFQGTLDILTGFANTARSAGGEGSFVSMNFVVHNANIGEIEAMAELARRVGAAQIQYRLIQPRAVHRNLMLSEQELALARQAVRRVEQANAADTSFTVQVAQSLRTAEAGGHRAELRPGVTPESFHDDRTRVPCIEGYVASYVDADGTVFSCCLRSSSISNHFMGDVTKTPFSEIWRGKAYEQFRRESFMVDLHAATLDENSCAYCPKAKHFLYLVDEFAAGNYLDLARRRAANVASVLAEVRQRVLKQVVLPAEAMRPAFLAHNVPPMTHPGKRIETSVTVRNDSTRVWPGADLAGPYAIGLGYHLLDRRSHMLSFDNNPRAYLPHDLSPGEAVDLPLIIAAPETAGSYVLELAMVQENVAWFEHHGGAMLRVPWKIGT